MTQRRQSFLSGAAVLAGAVAVTKVLGALYKIPLGNLLDSQGMAHFYAAYNVYINILIGKRKIGLFFKHGKQKYQPVQLKPRAHAPRV